MEDKRTIKNGRYYVTIVGERKWWWMKLVDGAGTLIDSNSMNEEKQINYQRKGIRLIRLQ